MPEEQNPTADQPPVEVPAEPTEQSAADLIANLDDISDLDESTIEDQRPQAWHTNPIIVRLVGRKVIDGHLTFVVADVADGRPRLRRWWMPSATDAMNHMPGQVMRDLLDNPETAQMRLSFAALEHSAIDEATLTALMSLPAQSTGEVLGAWMSTQDNEGTTAGESLSSAAG